MNVRGMLPRAAFEEHRPSRESPRRFNSLGLRQTVQTEPWFSGKKFALTVVIVCSFHVLFIYPVLRDAKTLCSVLEPQAVDNTARSVRFMLYRVIGNNMPPLQCPSQLLWNTQYALKYEPELVGCKKRWVLNQIMNATERGLLIDSLLASGYTLDDIIIRHFNVTKVGETPQPSWVDAVTAQNEARNVALDDGVKSGARWILPFDGNHFITEESWRSIVQTADRAEQKGYKYFKVPVHRLHQEQNSSWVSAKSRFTDIMQHAPIMIESQLAFRNDAKERFQEGMVYGQQNKLELLARACGSPKEPEYRELCECSDLGQEGQPHKSNETIAEQCGYSLRLWFYPCNGTDPHRVFYEGLYRKRLRTAARKDLAARIKRVMRNPRLLEE